VHDFSISVGSGIIFVTMHLPSLLLPPLSLWWGRQKVSWQGTTRQKWPSYLCRTEGC